MRYKRVALIILAVLVIGMVIFGIAGYRYYKIIYTKNVELAGAKEAYIHVKTGYDYDQVRELLLPYLIDSSGFEWVVERKNYKNNIKPGKYKLRRGMSNNELVNMLRGGLQSPVKVVFNNIRTKEQLASKISMQIEADSLQIINLLNNHEFISSYDLNKETVMCIFIPNTYELFWNTTAQGFFKRMYREYEKFWTRERLKKAEKIGLTKYEVSTLASIVDEETTMKDEMPLVAGVYMNRLAKGMRLQADPTVVFAWNDFSIKRVLSKHLEIVSPYNTYKYSGLPPGPISMPSISALDAVLNYKKHKYLYFCAKEDFSGYHNFAKTLAQHNRYANLYQKALNKRRIYK